MKTNKWGLSVLVGLSLFSCSDDRPDIGGDLLISPDEIPQLVSTSSDSIDNFSYSVNYVENNPILSNSTEWSIGNAINNEVGRVTSSGVFRFIPPSIGFEYDPDSIISILSFKMTLTPSNFADGDTLLTLPISLHRVSEPVNFTSLTVFSDVAHDQNAIGIYNQSGNLSLTDEGDRFEQQTIEITDLVLARTFLETANDTSQFFANHYGFLLKPVDEFVDKRLSLYGFATNSGLSGEFDIQLSVQSLVQINGENDTISTSFFLIAANQLGKYHPNLDVTTQTDYVYVGGYLGVRPVLTFNFDSLVPENVSIFKATVTFVTDQDQSTYSSDGTILLASVQEDLTTIRRFENAQLSRSDSLIFEMGSLANAWSLNQQRYGLMLVNTPEFGSIEILKLGLNKEGLKPEFNFIYKERNK